MSVRFHRRAELCVHDRMYEVLRACASRLTPIVGSLQMQLMSVPLYRFGHCKNVICIRLACMHVPQGARIRA